MMNSTYYDEGQHPALMGAMGLAGSRGAQFRGQLGQERRNGGIWITILLVGLGGAVGYAVGLQRGFATAAGS